jgi:uncharacterized protein (TIGR03437 family)
VIWGGATQLTATVTAASGGVAPTGTVIFESGGATLGTAELSGSIATLTLSSGQFPVGNRVISALYSGSASLSGSAGATTLSVVGSGGSAVVASATPNPVYQTPPDPSGFTWIFSLQLTETAGVSTRLTGVTVNGTVQPIANYFPSPNIQANGSITAVVGLSNLNAPVTNVYGFTGVDANGGKWSQQIAVSFAGPLLQGTMTLSAAAGPVMQNLAAAPSCQWSQQLNLAEQDGFNVQLFNFTAGPNDWSDQIQQLFGTTRLAPFGSLQATLCSAGATPPPSTEYEIDGVDDDGNLVTARLTSTFAGPAASAGAIATTLPQVTMAVANAPLSATATLGVSVAGSSPAWSISVLPANRTTTWLKVSPLAGAAAGQVTLQASGAGLANGVYRATLVLQAPGATPQYVNVPVVFVVGISTSASIDNLANGASFVSAFAPGSLMTVFGSELAFSTAQAPRLPLPLSMAGVSATVNGVAAPLYYVSPSQLNIQIPYETGAGTAVLGVNNLGQVSYYTFQVAASAPGIFADQNGALLPSASGKRGQALLLFVTGDGDVFPPLADGATPPANTPVTNLPKPRLPVTVTIGGQTAQTVFTGIPNGLAGATQINFIIPQNAELGIQPLVVTVGGVSSPAVNLTVTQ